MDTHMKIIKLISHITMYKKLEDTKNSNWKPIRDIWKYLVLEGLYPNETIISWNISKVKMHLAYSPCTMY